MQVPTCEPVTRRLGPRAWISVGLCVVMVFPVVLAVVIVLFPRGKSHAAKPQLLLRCPSSDCSDYEALLRRTINTSIKPCDDFKAFVTSRWLLRYNLSSRMRWMKQWNVQAQWTRMMIDEIPRRHFSNSAINLVVNAYTVCLGGAREKAGENREAFRQFLQNLSIPWPETPVWIEDKLDVLFKLCVKWDIHLWFTVKLLPNMTIAGRRVLHIGPSRYAFLWSNLYKDMSDEDARRYVGEYVKYFSFARTDAEANGEVDHFLVFNITKYIVSKLAGLCTRRSAKLTMESLARSVGVSTNHWISVVNKYFKPNENFLPTDTVVVRPVGIINAVRDFTSKYESSLIQSHLGWWILQIFAPIISDAFFHLKHGSQTAAVEIRPVFCQILTEESYKLLVLANHIALHFPPSTRQNVDLVLSNVREEAATFLETLTPPSDTNKRVARKLRDMKINLWPKPEYLDKHVLELIYASPRTYNTSTMEFWISERKANAKLTGSDAYFESTRLAHSFSDEPFVYDNVLNSATLSMAAVHAPFYYNDMNKAVNYGGLGAAFLKTVLQGMYDDGDGDQSLGHGNAWSHRRDAVNCLDNRNISRVSFTAALRAFTAIKENDQFTNVSNYPPEAFFFVSYCHTQSRLKPLFNCNEDLRGIETFLRAFRCGRGSGMLA